METSARRELNTAQVQLEPSWIEQVGDLFESESMRRLKSYLLSEKASGQAVYPRASDWFRAFWLTPFHNVRVVILGQDPYHGEGQAHGLSFSVPEGVPLPPSLRNIIKELESDLGCKWSGSGDLTHWARQGVLLLNSVLTVRKGEPASHQGQGWERFTDEVIGRLSSRRTGLVFILWGAFAQKKRGLIDGRRHLIIESVHPSPLSAHRGFFGSHPFSRANLYLTETGSQPIDWVSFAHRASSAQMRS